MVEAMLAGASAGDKIYQAKRSFKALEKSDGHRSEKVQLAKIIRLAENAKQCAPDAISKLSKETREAYLQEFITEGISIPPVLRAALITQVASELNVFSDGGEEKLPVLVNMVTPWVGAGSQFNPLAPTLGSAALNPDACVSVLQAVLIDELAPTPACCRGVKLLFAHGLALCTAVCESFSEMEGGREEELPAKVSASGKELLDIFRVCRAILSPLPTGLNSTIVCDFVDPVKKQRTSQKKIVKDAMAQDRHDTRGARL